MRLLHHKNPSVKSAKNTALAILMTMFCAYIIGDPLPYRELFTVLPLVTES